MNNQKTFKKTAQGGLTVLLTVVLMLSLVPAMAFALGEERATEAAASLSVGAETLSDDAASGFIESGGQLSASALLIGFFTAFVTGAAACKWMLEIVKKGKLIYFAYYCIVVGIITVVYSQLG